VFATLNGIVDALPEDIRNCKATRPRFH